MKWLALATDFDGTIATEGIVPLPTIQALIHARESGLKLLLVTGRELRDLEVLRIEMRWFDLVVAENGAVLYDPHAEAVALLAPAPSAELVAELQRLGVSPISVGKTIIATLEPHEIAAVEAIKTLGLELVVTFNKGSVMILPPGVNKASGLQHALQQLNISFEAVVGVGDAENDHSFLSRCGLSVAVANALPALQERAHLVTASPAGAGVEELVHSILNGELDTLP